MFATEVLSSTTLSPPLNFFLHITHNQWHIKRMTSLMCYGGVFWAMRKTTVNARAGLDGKWVKAGQTFGLLQWILDLTLSDLPKYVQSYTWANSWPHILHCFNPKVWKICPWEFLRVISLMILGKVWWPQGKFFLTTTAADFPLFLPNSCEPLA